VLVHQSLGYAATGFHCTSKRPKTLNTKKTPE
jgi:hypothetical protein